MLINENYLPVLICLILISFVQPPSSYAEQHLKYSSCNPSACGDIHYISYPFRVKDDPEYCGHHDRSYEISCENNTTASIYIDDHKYHVRAIDYRYYTIRLADPSIKNYESCSLPTYSPNWKGLLDDSSAYRLRFITNRNKRSRMVGWLVTFLSCPSPLNGPLFVETSHCFLLSSNSSTTQLHTYIKAGDLDPRDLGDMCRVDLILLISSLPIIHKDEKNDVSLLKIHKSFLYGFELSWSVALCECNAEERCLFDGNMKATCVSAIACNYSYHMVGKELGKRIISRHPFRDAGLCSYESPKPRFYEALVRMLVVLVYSTALYPVVRILVGMPLFLGLIIYKLRRRHSSMFDVIEGFLESHNHLMPIRYSYSDIKKMSRGLREKLGQGGYGSVYKGMLRSGNTVAVKVLSKPSTNGQDFINEVATLGRIHHINVVKLIGYCAERSKCALVYDFMPNGSLEKYICCEETQCHSLSWDKKHEIAVGVARGIDYLHHGCDIKILHFDIKPHNILLDDDFNPKISDFGLAKFYSAEKNVVTFTVARGTIGYVAPELINRSIGVLSYKADVYSFGMLLIEMVGIKRDSGENNCNSSQYFPQWIYDDLNKTKDIEIEKIHHIGDERKKKITRRMTIVALWCIQMRPDDRPSMSKVLEMLESDVELLQIPPQDSEFYEQVAQNEDQAWKRYSNDSTALLSDGSSLGYN